MFLENSYKEFKLGRYYKRVEHPWNTFLFMLSFFLSYFFFFLNCWCYRRFSYVVNAHAILEHAFLILKTSQNNIRKSCIFYSKCTRSKIWIFLLGRRSILNKKNAEATIWNFRKIFWKENIFGNDYKYLR